MEHTMKRAVKTVMYGLFFVVALVLSFFLGSKEHKTTGGTVILAGTPKAHADIPYSQPYYQSYYQDYYQDYYQAAYGEGSEGSEGCEGSEGS